MIACDRLEAPELLAKIRQSNGVVKNSIGAIIISIGSSNNTNHREILTISPSNGVEHTKPTHSKRDHTSPNATRPGIPVSGVASIELIAAPNVGEPGLGNEVIEKG